MTEQHNAEEKNLSSLAASEFKGMKIYSLRSTTASKVQFEPFNKETYTKESQEVIINERGKQMEKFVEQDNYIRFRSSEAAPSEEEKQLYSKFGVFPEKKVESNAKLVHWSDGSIHLVVGNKHFEIVQSETKNTKLTLIQDNTYSIKGNIDKKLMLKADSSRRDTILKVLNNNSKISTKTAYSFFDSNEYNKEDFAKNQLGRKRNKD